MFATINVFSSHHPLAVLVVLHLCILRYSPQHKSCWSCRLQLYVTQIFLSPFFLYFFILKFRNLFLSVPPVLSCVFFCSLSPPPFYSFLLFFLLRVLSSSSLFIHFVFWFPLLFSFQICYPFFSFPFSYYSILSASPLRSITIHSVLFLLEPSVWYFFAISFAVTSVFFILFLFGKDLMTLPVLCFQSFCLFSFPLFFFCSFYASFLLLFLFFSLCSCILFFFCSLLSSFLYATPVLTVDFFYILTHIFSIIYLFVFFIFIIFVIFLVLYFVCIALLLLPTD